MEPEGRREELDSHVFTFTTYCCHFCQIIFLRSQFHPVEEGDEVRIFVNTVPASVRALYGGSQEGGDRTPGSILALLYAS